MPPTQRRIDSPQLALALAAHHHTPDPAGPPTVDLFAGAGGLSLGAHAAGARLVAAEVVLAALVGRVFRIDADGSIWRLARAHNGKLFPMSPVRAENLHPQGYLRVGVRIAGVNYRTLAHRVVWCAARGPVPAGYQINHRDGNKANNALSNLELVTPSQNIRHSLDVLGVKRARGSKHGNAILNEDRVREIRTRFAAGESRSAIAASLRINVELVGGVIRRASWRHVE